MLDTLMTHFERYLDAHVSPRYYDERDGEFKKLEEFQRPIVDEFSRMKGFE